MSNVYFTSDLHIGHAKVAAIRGFESVDHHDAWIAAKLAALQPKDQLWVLGDISSGSRRSEDDALELIRYSVGCGPRPALHLVSGNHDSCHPMHRDAHRRLRVFLEVFDSVQSAALRKAQGQDYLLSHFPYKRDRGRPRHTQWRLADEGEWLLHGHTHGTEKVNWVDSEIHVGLDAWRRFVTWDEIIEIGAETVGPPH